MPPKPTANTLPLLSAPPSLSITSPTIPFPEFSPSSILSFCIDVLDNKTSENSGTASGTNAKKAPAKKGKNATAGDVDFSELAQKNALRVDEGFIGRYLKGNAQDAEQEGEAEVQDENTTETVNEEHGNEEQEPQEQVSSEELPEETQNEPTSEWRPMNRMTKVLRGEPSVSLSHPFSDVFHADSNSGAPPAEDIPIDEHLLGDFVQNQKDQLEMYAKSSAQFKLPETPLMQSMMKPFLSALYYIMHNQLQLNATLGFGNYLWELIYPKRDVGSQLPTENEIYVVKLWYKGTWRMIAIDSKMPYDSNTKQMQLPQTNSYEYWPAILMKALMVLVGNESPRSQNLLFKDPLWCVQALCGPYQPRTLNTSNSLNCLREIRASLQTNKDATQKANDLVNLYAKRKYLATKQHEATIQQDPSKQTESPPPAKLMNAVEDDIPQNDCILCATCVAPNELNEDDDDQYFYDVGLDPSLIYQIGDLKYAKGKAVLHMFGFNQTQDWEGDMSYSDSNVWDAEFEEELGFLRQDRLIPDSSVSSLPVRDFWIPFDQFQQYFTTIHVLQNVSSLRNNGSYFGTSLRESFLVSADTSRVNELVFSLYYLSQEESVVVVQEDPKAKKGAKKGADTTPEPTDLTNEEDPVHPYDLVTLTVDTYDWKATAPPRKLTQITTYQMYDNLIRVPLPHMLDRTQQVVRVTVEGFSRRRTLLQCFAPLYEDVLTIGTEDDILLSKLGVKHLQFQPQPYPAQDPNEWRIWFMYNVSVSSDVWFSANLNLVPQENTESAESEQKDPDQNDSREENLTQDETAKSVPLNDLLPHVNFLMIDNATRKTHHAAIGCCLYPLPLSVPENAEADAKSKKGAGPTGSYTLVAMAKAPKDVAIAAGQYSLEMMHQESGMESIQSVDSLFRSELKGSYAPSHARELLNYVLWAGENVHVSLHLELDRNVPTTLLIENESGEPLITAQIDERSSRALHITIPPIQMEPSQKNQEKCLIVRALVDEAYAHRMLHDFQRQQAATSFASQVEQTAVEEPTPEETQDDKKGKKGGKAPTKAAKGKGKAVETGRQVKIPAKQTEPQIIKTIPDINPPNSDAGTESEAPREENQNGECVQYSLNFTFTNPNVIIEEFNSRSEKVSTLINSWEEKEAGRLESGTQIRKDFFKQRARDFDAIGRKDVHIVENVKWEQYLENEAEWLSKSRWRKLNGRTDVVAELGSQEQFIENLEERIVQHEEKIKATLDALREQCKLDPATWSYQLKELDDQLQAQHNQILSTFEDAHRVRAEYLSSILEQVQAKLSDLEKRKAEHLKNAKKAGGKKK
uniref:Calpain catalytic domain-containing protein n=1 Tax=Percolomonas cosmopolitus TaxID=63605 RepID=A0A7S1KP22_9EUKA